MFMQRCISTLILVPLVLFLLFYGPYWLLAGLVLLVFCAMIKEYCHLIPLESLQLQVGYGFMLFLALGLCYEFFLLWLPLGLVVWILIIAAILTFPASQPYWGSPLWVALLGLIVLPLCVQSLNFIYSLQEGTRILVYVLFLIWTADIGAYLFGKWIGKHRLIPQVSPGKSWEGVLGGYGLSLLVALGGIFYFKINSIVLWFFLALMTVTLSIFGDLLFSMLKRRCQIKDTGMLIPGHGGILDRLDSLTAALPVFYWGLTYFNLLERAL